MVNCDFRDELDIDEFIDRVMSAKSKPVGYFVPMTEDELIDIAFQALAVFSEQSMLIEVDAPVKFCGDIHGQFYDLLRVFDYGGDPRTTSYVFLGDYVDRGRQSIECIALLFALKIRYPDTFHLLRGNHESDTINRIYGFYDECKRRFSVKVWKAFCEAFNFMPVSALVSNKILCMHGGMSPLLNNIDQIRNLSRPTAVPESGLMCDLLWSDPEKNILGFADNCRGVSYVFGPSVVTRFLRSQNLDLIVRAHQVVEDGYEFFADRKLVTVFSAPNYCDEFDNSAAIMSVDAELLCSFQILQPAEKKVLQSL